MNVQALFPNVGCMSEEVRSFDPVLGKMQFIYWRQSGCALVSSVAEPVLNSIQCSCVVRPLVAFIKPEVQQIYSEVVEEG